MAHNICKIYLFHGASPGERRDMIGVVWHQRTVYDKKRRLLLKGPSFILRLDVLFFNLFLCLEHL